MQSELRRLLGNNVGADELIDDPVEAVALASDVYIAGTALGALRCRSADTLSRAMAILHRERIAMVPRGGGMSYTGGYVPARSRSVIIDTSLMDRIIEISAENMLITRRSRRYVEGDTRGPEAARVCACLFSALFPVPRRPLAAVFPMAPCFLALLATGRPRTAC